jgi:hypothetical protein
MEGGTAVRTLPILALMSALVPSIADAQPDYFPLRVGNQWSYSGSAGGAEVQTVTGTTEILGTTVFVVRFSQSTNNEGLEDYWSVAADGDVMLSGFFRSNEGWGFAYDPPVVLVHPPLAVGSQWIAPTTIYNLPDGTLFGDVTFGLQVYEEVVLTVPAGNFPAFGIGQFIPGSGTGSMPSSLQGQYTLTGERVAGVSPATDWWTEGVGRPRYVSDQVYDLESYGIPTPSLASSWGSLKVLFRQGPRTGRASPE